MFTSKHLFEAEGDGFKISKKNYIGLFIFFTKNVKFRQFLLYSTGQDQRDTNFCVHVTTLNAFTVASQRDIGSDLGRDFRHDLERYFGRDLRRDFRRDFERDFKCDF